MKRKKNEEEKKGEREWSHLFINRIPRYVPYNGEYMIRYTHRSGNNQNNNITTRILGKP